MGRRGRNVEGRRRARIAAAEHAMRAAAAVEAAPSRRARAAEAETLTTTTTTMVAKSIPYDAWTVDAVRAIYAVATCVWIVGVAVWVCGERRSLPVSALAFLAIPVAVFAISSRYAGTGESLDEFLLLGENFLYFGSIAALLLLRETVPRRIVEIFFVGLAITIVGMFDVWVKPSQRPLLAHLRTVAQTAGVTLMLMAVAMMIDRSEWGASEDRAPGPATAFA